MALKKKQLYLPKVQIASAFLRIGPSWVQRENRVAQINAFSVQFLTKEQN